MSAVSTVSPGSSTGGHPRGDVRPYVASWVIAGLAAAGFVLSEGVGAVDPGAVAAILAVTLVAELVEVRVTLDRTGSAFTLAEAAIAASMLLMPAGQAIVTALVGLGVVQLARRRGALKALFNMGQVAVAMSAALMTFRLVPHDPSPSSDAGSLIGVAVGMTVYGAVNVMAMGGLVRRLSDRSFAQSVREHGGRLMASVLGNTAIGMLIAVLWDARPALLILLAAPAAATHLSSRGSLRSMTLLAEVRAERDRLDRVVVGASDGIMLLDPDGRVELWSPAMEQLSGVPRDVAVGASAATLLETGSDMPQLFALDDGSEIGTFEGQIHRPDGTRREVHAIRSQVAGKDGRSQGAVVVVRDVTRQKEVESMKHDFIARVSHELRTPLAPIQGMAQMLLRNRAKMDDTRMDRALGLIAERSEHMGHLVEDLLLASRISSNTSDIADEISLERLDLGGLADKAVGWAHDDHPDRTFNLVCEDQTSAVADEVRTTQIVSNLLSNAVKYSPVGSPVDVEVTTVHDDVAIAVCDRGPGIPDDKKQIVFDRFQRLEDPMTMTTGGVGLGLFIARRLAEAMNGTLQVTDRENGGSRFELTLPRRPSSAPTTDERSSPRGSQTTQDLQPTGKTTSGSGDGSAAVATVPALGFEGDPDG